MNTQQTIGSIVANNYRTAEVFSKMKIDFCCKGGRSSAEVCQQQNIDSGRLIAALEEAQKQPAQLEDENIQQWSAAVLAEYIEKHHHHYVREATPILAAYLKKIAAVHGERHPELLEVYTSFVESSTELLRHMINEETILFPSIKRLESIASRGATMDKPFFFGTVENPISTMRDEHEVEGERFARMAALTNNYTPPEDACNTYMVALAKLQEFEEDLHRHIHLENNILFHKAVQLEKQVKQNEAEPAH